MHTIKLALIQKVHLYRNVLINYICKQRHLKVVYDSPDLLNLLDDVFELSNVHILLLDVCGQSDMAQQEAFEKIKIKHPRIKILAIGSHMQINHLEQFIKRGIHGCVAQEDDPSELIKAIDAITKDALYVNTFYTRILHAKICRDRVKDECINSLNDREKKILQLLWEEKSNEEIANEIFLGIRSVEKIRQNLKEKLGVKSTIGLLKYAVKNNIICF